MVKNCLIVFEMPGKISFLNQTEDIENLSFIKKPKILVVMELEFFLKNNPGQFLKSRFIGKKKTHLLAVAQAGLIFHLFW